MRTGRLASLTFLSLSLVLCGCPSPNAAAPTTGILRGSIDTAGVDRGNGFVFLYPNGKPPEPQGTGRPQWVTGVPEQRLFGGAPPNADFVFAGLAPATYLARGIVNTRGTFDPFIDVMAQPFAGDLDTPLQSVDVVAGRTERVDLSSGKVIPWDPPMFVMDTVADNQLFTVHSNEQANISIIHLKASALPFGDPSKVQFLYGTATLVDGGLADFNNDGVPDIFPQVILQRLPQPDDGPEFKDADGGPLQIVLASTAQPDPVAGTPQMIGNDQVTQGMFVLIPPVAVVVLPPDASGKVSTRQLPSLPVGFYQITVLTADGQYWQVPNGLGPDGIFAANHGGPYLSQGPRFAVIPAQ
jgi:hypothetical protein